MARTEARIFASIWDDEEFLGLPATAQRLYMFLLSQKTLTYCGVMPLRPATWAGKATGLTAADIEQDIKALEAAHCRFVVTDEDTRELLIRSFMRNDEVWKQPNLMKAARAAGALVESDAIRDALLQELRRIPAAESPSRFVREVHSAFVKDLTNGSPNPSGNPSSQPGDSVAAGQGDRTNPSGKGSGMGSAEGSPKPSPDGSPNPLQEKGEGNGSTTGDSLTPALLSAEVANPSGKGSANPFTADQLVADWLDHLRKRPPESVIAQVGKHIKAMLNDGIDPADIRAGIVAWARKGLNPSALPSCVNELMNASAAHAPPGRASPRQQADNDMFIRAAARIAAREEPR